MRKAPTPVPPPLPPQAAVFLLCLFLTGCGNQMYRQPSYTPLDTPRAAPPTEAVPVSDALTPTDGRPVSSTAFGARVQLAGETEPKLVTAYFTKFPPKEPVLPPPNLSDNARYEKAPVSVDSLKNPLPEDPQSHPRRPNFISQPLRTVS